MGKSSAWGVGEECSGKLRQPDILSVGCGRNEHPTSCSALRRGGEGGGVWWGGVGTDCPPVSLEPSSSGCGLEPVPGAQDVRVTQHATN